MQNAECKMQSGETISHRTDAEAEVRRVTIGFSRSVPT